MSKLTESANGESCTFQIPGICSNNPETVVLCHAPHPDKGRSIKGPDSWAAYGCYACHAVMDNRGHPYWKEAGKGLYYLEWFQAIRETQRRMLRHGLLNEA